MAGGIPQVSAANGHCRPARGVDIIAGTCARSSVDRAPASGAGCGSSSLPGRTTVAIFLLVRDLITRRRIAHAERRQVSTKILRAVNRGFEYRG